VRILEAQFYRPPFAIFHLSLEQRFEIVKMRVVLLTRFIGQRCELGSDRGETKRLAVLCDACSFHAHACTPLIPTESSWLYSIIVGKGRSYAASTPISIVSWAACCNWSAMSR